MRAKKSAKRSARKTAKRRKDAELFAAADRAPKATEGDVRRLLHELQVHSEETTVQNDQLIKAQAELEQARDRYADLYDFAPIGYMLIDSRGTIADINLRGAELLARTRTFIVNLPLTTMVVREHLDALRGFLAASRQQHDGQTLEMETRVRRMPERMVRLVSRPLGGGGGAARLLIAIFDVTDERRLGAERAAALEREQARSAELSRALMRGQEAEARIKALLERVVKVQEDERRRIARNLHDHLGQQMTALRLTINALKTAAASAEEVREQLDTLDRITAKMDRDLDTIAWDLRPPALDDVGLNGALDSLVREWSAVQGVPAEFHVSQPEAIRLTSDIESHLYRIVQEALTNVAKHAAATRVSVILERRGDDVVAVIEDDGRGFDIDSMLPDHRHGSERRMGLISMQERAALVGGSMQLESARGAGTTLFVRMPVQAVVRQLVAQNPHN